MSLRCSRHTNFSASGLMFPIAEMAASLTSATSHLANGTASLCRELGAAELPRTSPPLLSPLKESGDELM